MDKSQHKKQFQRHFNNEHLIETFGFSGVTFRLGQANFKLKINQIHDYFDFYNFAHTYVNYRVDKF